MPIPILLIGGGGHCLSCIEVIESTEKFSVAGVIGPAKETDTCSLPYPYLGNDDDLFKLIKTYKYALITVGQIKSAAIRTRLYEQLTEIGFTLPAITASSAVVSRNAILSAGTIALHRTVINSGAKVMDNCIINTGAIIEHDCVIGAHTHVSTGAIVNGACQLGSRCLIGSGAVLKQGIVIADDVIVGAGSIVINDIKEAGVYVGSPARRIHA